MTRRRVLSLLAPGMFVTLAGCNLLGTPSRVRAGELYTTGQERYDAYFAEVHKEQESAAKWPDDEKSAKRPLIGALALGDDASDAEVTQATKDHLSAGTLRLDVSGNDARIVPATDAKAGGAPHDVLDAVLQTAHAEMQLAKKLRALSPKLEEMAKAGHELEPHIAEDFGAQHGQKPFEVKEEIHASYDVLADLAERAKKEAKVAEDFVTELQRAVSTGSEAPITTPHADKPERPHGASKPPRHDDTSSPRPAPPPPRPASVSHSDAPPAPKPPKPPADNGEVFQP